MKRCTKCGVEQPLDNYYRHKTTRDGKHTHCKDCMKAANRQQWKEKGRVYAQAKTYREPKGQVAVRQRTYELKDYRLTVTEYDAMLAKQNGACAICRNPCALGRRLAVDHDHTTGKVRGLLCSKCNRGIGNFDDNAKWLRRAANYLGGHDG